MTPQAIKADYVANFGNTNGNTPVRPLGMDANGRLLGVNPNDYQWKDNNSGGVNYFRNDAPTTREIFAAGSGQDVGGIENWVADQYRSRNQGQVQGAATTADPFAQWGGQDKYNSMRTGFGTQRENILSGANEAVGNAGRQYGSSILDFLDSLKAGQRNIDRQGVQNELARSQGNKSILASVGRGIQSGGVMLANKNASDSSASGAIANAYGELGRRQLSDVGNQYAQGQSQLGQLQEDLGLQQQQGMRHLEESKTQVVNGIVSQARNDLAALDAAIAGASLPDRIQIESEKERIRSNALSQLQQYDQQLSQGVAGVRPMGADQIRGQASQLASAGVAPESSFDFTEQAPAQFSGTGPFPSALPLFQLPRRRQG